MKKMMKTLAFVAVAAMGLTACQNDFEEQIEAKDSVVVTFIADSAESRTAVDTTGEKPVFSWNDSGESFAVLEQTDALAAANSVTFENKEGKAHITAEFAANPDKGEYSYVTVYPASGYVSAENISAATLTLPAEQTMVEGSYDPAADLMVSEVKTATAQPNEAQMVGFHRIAAVVKMSISNLAIGADEQIEKVEFMADGKQLAGKIVVDLNDPATFTPGAGSNFVSVATTASDLVYFTVLPTILAEGDTYTITVVTKNRLYIKQGAVPEGKSLEFKAGSVTRFSVNMQGVAPSDKWVLVKDASTLKQGDVVAIAAKDYDKALSTKLYNNASETSTSAKRASVDISKIGDYLISNSEVQNFVLVAGGVEGTFAFYDEAREKFLVSNNKTSRYLINQSYIDANTSFNISVTDGNATIKNITGDYSGCMIKYYLSDKIFYSGTSTANKDVCIYRLEGAVGTIPVVDANVTVPDSDESVVIAEEGATTATAISDVVFNYVGPWTISVSDNAEWLNVAYDATNNCLTYTAEPNTGAKRETTVTITATLEGEEALTWSFKVLQKGAPQEITIAEFVKLAKDVNTMYKLTGKIATKPSSNTGDWILTDANDVKVTIKRLKTDGGVYAYDVVDLKVGDVMTVTAVPAGVSSGLAYGGSSTYPAIYKGHYNLSATVEPELIGYEGGTANISVAVNTYGNIGTYDVPTAIEGSMAESDFAEFSYTTGAATATVTFEENTGGSREVNVTFTSGLAEATVAISQKNHPDVKVGWFLVTDASELKVGDNIIIAAKNKDYAMSTTYSSSGYSFAGKAITKQGTELVDVADNIRVWTLMDGYVDGEFAITYPNTTTSTYFLSTNSATKDRLVRSSGTLPGALTYNASWKIAIDAEGVAFIDTTYGTTTPVVRRIKCNYTTANVTFSTYLTDTDKEPVCIYKYYN